MNKISVLWRVGSDDTLHTYSLFESKLQFDILGCRECKNARDPLQLPQHWALHIIASRAPNRPGCATNNFLIKRCSVLDIEYLWKPEVGKFIYQFHCDHCPTKSGFFTSESRALKACNTRATSWSNYLKFSTNYITIALPRSGLAQVPDSVAKQWHDVGWTISPLFGGCREDKKVENRCSRPKYRCLI